MRKFLLIIIAFLCNLTVYSQEVSNGVIGISNKMFSTEVDKLTDIDFSLAKYFIDESSVEYYIKIKTQNNKVVSFPHQSKLLFKLTNDDILELTKIFGYADTYSNNYLAYFPISEQDIRKLYNGITKIRVELLSARNGEQTREIKDIEFKKEKFGKEIQDAFESIEKENKKLSKKVLERQAEQLKKRAINNSTDIRTGF